MRQLGQDQNIFRFFLTIGGSALMTLLIETWITQVGLVLLLCVALLSWFVMGFMVRLGFRDMAGGEISLMRAESSSRFELFLTLLILGLAIFHASFYLFEANGFWWMKNPNLNGDLPFHWQQIRYLARGPEFWPSNPQYTGESLRYAFGMNWLSALGLRSGLPFGVVLVLPLLVSIVLVGDQLWKWAGLWGVVAFFGSGGGWLMPAESWLGLWGPGEQLAWKNLFLAILVTQRGFWFALPAGILWLRFLLEMNRYPWLAEPARWRLLFALWACLPFFHLHTFVILTLFGGLLVLMGPLRKQARAIFQQGLYWAWIPLIFIWQSVSWVNSQNSVRWVWNWMSNSEPLLSSWGKNFGLWLVILLVAIGAAVSRARSRGQILIPAPDVRAIALWLGLGLLFSHLMLAPWAWDQSKILLWVYLGLSMAMGSMLMRLGPLAVRLLLMVLIFLPGLVQFVGGLPSRGEPYKFWSVADQTAVQNLLSALHVEERVLVAPSPHHPVLATGQPLVAGYIGHLWSHGLNVRGLETELRQMVTGADSRLDAPYLLWGPLERDWFGVSEPTATLKGEPRWVKIRSSGDWVLYARAR